MNDMNAAPPTNAGKVYKSNQKKTKEQSELFYVKKRGLFRKAEQVVRYCNSEVFIIVHNLDNDKIFSFTSDKDFNLEKISTLVLRDCQQGAFLNKNRKFENTDFEKVKQNIMQIQKINTASTQNQLNSPHLQHHQLMDKEQMVPEETITEDMSLSMQQIGSNNEGSAPVNNPQRIGPPKNNQVTFNSHSNTGTFENAQFSPKHGPAPSVVPNMPVYQQPPQVQVVNYGQSSQHFNASHVVGNPAMAQYPQPQAMPMMTQQRVNQQSHIDQDFNMTTGQPHQAVQAQYQQVQKSPIRAPNDPNYQHQMQGSPPMMKSGMYPFAAAGASHVESNQSYENTGDFNDMHHYRNQEYQLRYQKQQMEMDDAVNNDDIFACADFNYQRQQQQPGGVKQAQQPHASQLAAGIPGRSGVDKRQNPFTKNQSQLSNTNTILPNKISGVQSNYNRSDVSGPNQQQYQMKRSSLVNDRPNRENNFGREQPGRNPHHGENFYSPSSHIDMADQVITSPNRNPVMPIQSHRVKGMRGYTGMNPDQRSGVIESHHISKISVGKPSYVNSQVSDENNDDQQYAHQRNKITSGVLMATSQIHQQNFGPNNSIGGFAGQKDRSKQRYEDPNSKLNQQEKGQLYMQSIGEQHIYNISYNYPGGQRKDHMAGQGQQMMMDQQQYENKSQNYSQVRNHSPASATKKQLHSQEIYKEAKMHDQVHDQTMQPYNNGEFRVSDVVINNNQNQEFHPMRNEQAGFNVSVSMPQQYKGNVSQISRKNYSQLSKTRQRSGSGNGSNGSGVRSNRSATYIQQH